MTADPKCVQAVFLLAVELNSPTDRADLLDRECGTDADLRRRVEALLLAHNAPDSSLDRPLVYDPHASTLGSEPTADMPARGAADPPSTVDHAANPGSSGTTTTAEAPRIGRPPAEGPGSWIGPYTLLRVIGEGGMGVVYEAEQTEPVRRTVALKVIKTGMDTEAVVARFEAERQALALMEHPNIARVLDAGSTATGRPFFVMEFVRGERITTYCDSKRMSVRDRLALFVPVCQAIQQAHQKGIIHRDIKPSNVMVTEVDGKPVPKVIDFGVAKAVGQRLSDRMRTTQYGMLVGTPEYMSPEQASLGALDIDTRSDVYALGVLLYELLAGSTPLEGLSLRQAALDEVLRRIREEEPPKPSTRLAGTGSAPASPGRKPTPPPTEPAQPTSRDRLPSIAATRSTEPGRLARQVRGDLDWVVMKAIEKDRARRYETANGLARDIQRFLDGDPVEAGPPSAIYRIKKFARKHRVVLATVAAFAALLVAATAVSAGLALWANRERLRAEEREDSAINAVKRFRDAVAGEEELKNNPGLEELRKRLLKEPLAFFRDLRERLQGDHDTRPESLARLASATSALGSLTNEIGDQQDALSAYQESLAIYKALAEAHPAGTRFQDELAHTHNSIGILLSETGRRAEAMKSFETALAINKALAGANPMVSEFQIDVTIGQNNIGSLFAEQGRTAEALRAFEAAKVVQQKLAIAHPDEIDYQRDLGYSHVNIGTLLRDTGHPAEALDAYAAGKATLEKLAREQPANTKIQRDLANTYEKISLLLRSTGKKNEALKAIEQSLAIRKSLAEVLPSVTALRSELANGHFFIASQLSDSGHPTEAVQAYEKALDITKALVAANPTVIRYQTEQASFQVEMGLLLHEIHEPAKAMKEFEDALLIRERLVREDPGSAAYVSSLGALRNNIATVHMTEERLEDAREQLFQAIDLQRRALDANPSNPEFRQRLVNHLRNLILVARRLGRAEEAAAAQRQLDELAASDPRLGSLDANMAEVIRGEAPKDNAERLVLAQRAYDTKRYALAARLWHEALESDPKLGDDRQAQHRYNAACAAALAATCQGKDDPLPDNDARSKLRARALAGLEAELAVWTDLLGKANEQQRVAIVQILRHWREDSDLVGIRDEAALMELPAEEQAKWRGLWTNVGELLERAKVRP